MSLQNYLIDVNLMNRNILFFLITFFALTACTKYDEGPKISLRRDFKKFLGTWHIDKFYVNDIDSTASFKNENGDSLYFKEFTKKEDSYYQEGYNNIYLFKKVNELISITKYGYIVHDNRFVIFIKSDGSSCSHIDQHPILGIRHHFGRVSWEIKRLSMKELFMEATDTLNNRFRIEMTKLLNNGYVVKF